MQVARSSLHNAPELRRNDVVNVGELVAVQAQVPRALEGSTGEAAQGGIGYIHLASGAKYGKGCVSRQGANRF